MGKDEEFLEIVPVIICQLAFDGKTLYVNRYIEEVTGYTPSELVGQNWWEVFYPDNLMNQVGHLYGLFDEGDVDSFVMMLVTKSGEKRYLSWSSHNFTDDNGNTIIAGIGVDISELKTAEHRTNAAYRLFDQAFEVSPVAMTLLDISGRFIYANKEAERVLGLTTIDITTRTYDDVHWQIRSVDGSEFPDEDLPFRRVIESGAPVRGVRHSIRWPDGTEKYFSVNAGPLFNHERKVVGMVVAFDDITEEIRNRKALERALHRRDMSNEISRAIIHSRTQDEILQRVCEIAVNTGGYLMAWTGRAKHEEELRVVPLKICGQGEKQVGAFEFTWDDETERLGPAEMAIREAEIQVIRSIRANSECGPWRERALEMGYESSLAVPFSLSENETGVLNVFSSEPDAFDSEEISFFQTIADDLSFGLEVKQTQRTLRTTLEHLQKASDRAFLYLDVLGHDIRNSLQSMVIGFELLEGVNPDDPNLELIKTSFDRATKAVMNAKFIDTLTGSTTKVQSLRAVLKKSVNRIQTTSPATIHVELPDDDAMVEADEYLSQAIMNVFENAIQHNSEEDLDIWLKVRERGDSYEITIADNGTGMSDQMKESAFDMSRRFGGLGLHLVKEIVEKSQGEIGITDRVKGDHTKGVKVVITLRKES